MIQSQTMMTSEPKETDSTFIKYIKVPYRILSSAVDIYVKSLAGSGTNIAYGNTMGCPTPHMPLIPGSFGVNSPNTKFRTVDEELPELIRMSSTTKINGGGGVEQLQRSKSSPAGIMRPTPDKVVVFGTIDEEREFDVLVGEEDSEGAVGLLRPGQVYSRSKSTDAVVSKRKVA